MVQWAPNDHVRIWRGKLQEFAGGWKKNKRPRVISDIDVPDGVLEQGMSFLERREALKSRLGEFWKRANLERE